MAFIFSTSHLPETRFSRPDDIEEEDEEFTPQPLPRAGGVRAFSHLPQPARALADTSGPLSTRPATPVSRRRPYIEPEDDQDIAHAPVAESDHDDAPPAHAEYADDTPWHSPRISTQDQPPESHQEDDHALEESDHPAPSMYRDSSRTRSSGFSPSPQDLRDAFHSWVPDSSQDTHPAQPYGLRDQGTSQPQGFAGKAEYHDMVYRPGKNPEEEQQQHRESFFQNAADTRATRPAPSAPRSPQTYAQNTRPAAQPQVLAQRPAANPAQNASAAPQQHPYKVNEADENAEFDLTDKDTKQTFQKGAKFGPHVRSIINEELEKAPTAKKLLDKARELSGKDVVIHLTANLAGQHIGLDGTIHIYLNPDKLKPGTLSHEIAHSIQLWHEIKAKRDSRGTDSKPKDQEEDKVLNAARSQGRNDLHAIAPVTYQGSDGKNGTPKSNGEPIEFSKENEAMRIANIVNAEISATKIKAKIEAFKAANPEGFNEMIKNPKKFADTVAEQFWKEQRNKESTHHQDNNNIDMPESTLYGEDYYKHVLDILGYGVTLDILKSKTPHRAEYHGFPQK